MKTKQLFMIVVMFITSMITASAQMMPPIPVDKDVRIGKLPNGLTYYIRYNNWPEDRAEFYIAQRVGSIQEEDHQRGLAHFLEHMCFNGTDNFPGNGVVRYCESIGVKFGRDLNAYTSIDETVYNISNVPTANQAQLDSCLLILHDWADGLILDPAEIDKERGVIHEEWRSRRSAAMRMYETAFPKLYPGCKYGHRLPIGIMEVVDNFKPQALRDYYEKWYHPENQAIIVVGDIDVDYTENKIKEMFGPIKTKPNASHVVPEMVPDNYEPLVAVEKDKEQQNNLVYLMMKHDAVPDSIKGTLAYLMLDYLESAAMTMLNERLGEVAKKSDCPFVMAQASVNDYLLSGTKKSFDGIAVPKDGQTEAALSAVYREALRAARFGFTPSEYSRAKANITSAIEKQYSNKDKRYSSQFCRQYAQHFLDNEPIPSIEDSYAIMNQLIPVIPLEAVNQLFKKYVTESDTNLVILSLNVEKDGAVYPTEEGLLNAVKKVRAENIEAFVDNVKNEPLITNMPEKGSIKKETKNETFGYTELLLSNGAKVVLKKTDFKQDQVILTGEGFGGSSLYGEADYANIKVYDAAIEASGLGNFLNTELEKAMAGKIASASLSMGQTRQAINGSSTPKDVETMLQLTYLYFTNIKKDEESFSNVMKTLELQLKNKAASPDAAFSDSLSLTLTCHNPRFAPITMELLKSVNYDRILEIAKEQTANAAAWTFTIVGNYDEATIRPLIEQYLASLPSQKKIVKGKDVETDAKGIVTNNFKRKMEQPKAIGVTVWSSDKMKYTLENKLKTDVVGQILSMVYTKKIREDEGAAYSVGCMGQMSRNDFRTTALVFVQCPMKPEKGELAMQIIRDELVAMSKSCDADKLTKVKEYLVKAHADRQKQNNYWISMIGDWRDYGIDMHSGYLDAVKALTPEAISAFASELLKAGNRVEVVMMPQE